MAKDISENITNGMLRYSLEEQEVGCWVDGKPLYQKTIDFGQLTNGTNKYLNHGIENIKMVVYGEAYAYSVVDDIVRFIPFPPAQANGNTLLYANRLFANKEFVGIGSSDDSTNYKECYITIRYTKTTD